MKKIISTAIAASAAFGIANAADFTLANGQKVRTVDADITTDTTWTTEFEYILTDVISVKNGKTLTINPGVVVRGEPKSASAFDPGTLVVTRDGQINAVGTVANPIIFTTAKVTDGTVDYGTAVDYAGKTMVDADPVNAPLTPGIGYTTTPGDDAHTGAGDEYRGLWGGIIILGNAPTSIVDLDTANDKVRSTSKNSRTDLDDVFEGFIEGLDPNVTLDNDGVYGGTNPNDSSGSLKYVSIRHGGTNLAEGNEINGLTMGGVGAGTLIEYVEVYCNNDDGFEWFGGTVNTRFLVSLYNNDDSFDIDEGFQGLGQFWFSLQLDDGVNGDHGGEHDGTDGNFSSVDVDSINGTDVASAGRTFDFDSDDDDINDKTSTAGQGDQGIGFPMAFPTIYNATYVGAANDQALKFDDSFGGAYYNSVFVGADSRFIDVTGDAEARINIGDCDFVKSSLVYNVSGNTGALSAAEQSNFAALQTILQNNNNRLGGTDPFATLSPTNVRANVDPRVLSSVSSNFASTEGLEPTTATFFIPAGYLGAFSPVSNNFWTDGWSVFDANVALAAGAR